MLHIYHGAGKGKTTAAFGMVLRQLGHQKKVLVLQFLKDGNSGEMQSLKQLSNVDFYVESLPQTFFYQMSKEEKEECKAAQQKLWNIAMEKSCKYDCILMDEVLDAINLALLSEVEVLEFLKQQKASKEILITGRNPSRAMRCLSDYDMELISHKHPYEKGIGARAGTEY